jgi:hypothetical protein
VEKIQIHYDTEWLKSQRFDVNMRRSTGDVAEGTYHVTGLLGIGSSDVAFSATGPDGKEIALKFGIPRLAFYLRELPISFRTPQHDVKRVNQKLSRLISDPLVNLLVDEYDQLYSNIFDSIRESNVSSVDKLRWDTVDAEVMMGFALRTHGFRYRVQEWVAGGSPRPEDAEWAGATLIAIDRIARTDPDLKPEELLENPFYVWGGAVMEWLFTHDDLSIAVSFLRDMFGPRSEDSQVDFWLNQTWIIGNLLQNLVDSPAVANFVEFHNLCNEMLST